MVSAKASSNWGEGQRQNVGIQRNQGVDADFAYARICWIGKKPYSGPVYDFSVATEHSYVALNALVSNSPPGYLGHRETTPVLAASQLQRQWQPPERQLSVVLFDEIEKAHPKFWDILLGVFDAGRLSLSDNSGVDFVPTIILMTGNIGSRQLAESISPAWGLGTALPRDPASGTSGLKSAENAARRLVKPEMFNRLDRVLTFQQLTRDDLPLVLSLELDSLQARLANRNLRLMLTDPAINLICDDGLDLRYGARHLKRSLSRHVEIPLANEIVDGVWKEGSTISCCVRDGHIAFTKG